MTDRIRTLTVVLDSDCRDDEIHSLVSAIDMIKGVQKVKIGDPIDLRDYSARQAIKLEIREKIYQIYKDLEK